jgi:hypothetical protein
MTVSSFFVAIIKLITGLITQSPFIVAGGSVAFRDSGVLMELLRNVGDDNSVASFSESLLIISASFPAKYSEKWWVI